MADGSHQNAFPFRHLTPTSCLRGAEIVVDLFAGGGGASHALETALARAIDIAINHNPWAIGMHAANHPHTKHLCEDVWEADPYSETRGRPIGWLHASPDCTHHSQARGGQPRSKTTRALSWVVLKWAGKLKRRGTAPRIISLENVEQILKWGPLVAKRDKDTGRVITLDLVRCPRTGKMVNRVAEPGERVPVDQQFLVPDKKHEGRTWRHFTASLRALGYEVDAFKLKASDYGAGTSRTRLYLVARCDGIKPQRPAPTHGKGLLPIVRAADCIDFTVPCPSIFTRRKPLADNTMRRIAKGLKRYVLDAAEPFIVVNNENNRPKSLAEPVPTITTGNRNLLADPFVVRVGQASSHGTCTRHVAEPLSTVVGKAEHCLVAPSLVPLTHQGSDRVADIAAPLPTITGANRGEISVVAPVLVQAGHGEGSGITKRRSHGVNDIQGPVGTIVASGGGHAMAAVHLAKFRGDSCGVDAALPMPTITSGAGAARPAGGAHALGVVTAFLEQANGGFYEGDGRSAGEPLSAITATATHQRLVTAHMAKLRGTSNAADAADPLATVSAGGEHHAVVECTLSPEHEEGALQVAAFLMRYYGTGGQHGELSNPLATVTTKDRLALVTVTIKGTPYVVVDIGLRMLRRDELFRAQGFPPDYIIDRTADGRPLSISKSVAMVGNSVSPPPLFAIARANLDPAYEAERLAA